MKPDEPLDPGKLARLVEDGSWAAAEEMLRALLAVDPEDLSARCQLATLLVLRGWQNDPGRRDEAVQHYDVCLARGWAPGLCLNNQGVLWALDRQAVPAVSALRRAAELPGGYAPALYNLGIICQRVAESGGGVPRLLRDQEVLLPEEKPAEAVRRYFDAALLDEEWAAQESRDRSSDGLRLAFAPLHLWVEDLSPSLGWLKSIDDRDYGQAEHYLREGRELLERGEHEQAIHRFQSAVGHVPDFAPRVEAYRIQAVLGYAAGLRRQVRESWGDGRFAEARSTLDTLLAMLRALPDPMVGFKTIYDEVTFLTGQLQTLAPGSDRSRLQQLIATIGHLVDQYKRNYSAAQQRTDSDEPDAELDAAGCGLPDPERLLADSRAECASVLQREVFRAVDQQDEEAVQDLLALAGTGWLGPETVGGIRREAFTRLAHGRLAAAKRPQIPAEEQANELLGARAAAEEAGDDGLAAEIDEQLQVLLARHADVDNEIRAAFRSGDDVRVLQLYADRTRKAPPSPALKALVRAVWNRQLEELDQTLSTDSPNWEAAFRIAKRLAQFRPTDEAVAQRLTRAQEGMIDHLLNLGELSLQADDLVKARARVEQAKALDARSEAARTFSDKLAALEVRRSGEPARAAFERANRGFSVAEAAGDPRQALALYLEMQQYYPDAPRTLEAAGWLFPAFMRELNSRGRTPEAASEIRELLGPLLDLESEQGDPSAGSLRDVLLRVEADVEGEARARAVRRSRTVEEMIAEADEALTAGPPDVGRALEVLARSAEYRPNGHQAAQIAAVRGLALQVAESRFERLVAVSGAAALQEARTLAELVRPWDGAAAGRMEARLRDLTGAVHAPGRSRQEQLRTRESAVLPLLRRSWALVQRWLHLGR